MSRGDIAFDHTPWVGVRSTVGAAAPFSGCPDPDGRTIRCADTSFRQSRVVSRKPATLSQFEAAPIPSCVCRDAFCCRHSIGGSLRERHPKYCTSASRPGSGRCGRWGWSGSELYGCSGWQLYGPPRPSTKTQPLQRNRQTAGAPFQANKRLRRRWGGSEHGHIAVPPCRCAATQGRAWFEFSAGGQDSVPGSRSGPGPSKTGDFAVLSHLQQLGCGEIKRRPREVHFSGCINESYAFHCTGGDFFVKINRTFRANDMFQGELEALRIMGLTSTVRIPKPLACGDLPETGSYIIMEYLPFRPFGMIQVDAQQKLGTLLGQMHTADMGTLFSGTSNFGFPLSTRLGVVPLNNNGAHSWRDFFVEQRLKDRLEMVFSKLGDEVPELRAIGDRLLLRAMDLLDGVDCMPSVLHGDLWIGNSGLTRNGEVAIFDPACFVGHSEFDLAFRGWFPSQASGFPGFGNAFYDAYHEVVPQEPGFADRHDLYQLFHLINHLLIYGMEYYPHVMEKAKKLL